MIYTRHRKTVLSAYLALVSLALFSCASPNPNAVHVTHMGVKAYGDNTTVPVRAGDTVYIMSQRLGVDLRSLIDTNNLKPPYNIYAGQRLRVPTPPVIQAQKGDTLFSIARAYNADQSEIVHLNNLKQPYRIAVGQQIKLPSVPVSTAAIVTTSKDAAPVLIDEPVYEVGHISAAADKPVEPRSSGMSQEELAASLSAVASSLSSGKAAKPESLPAPGALKKEDAIALSKPSGSPAVISKPVQTAAKTTTTQKTTTVSGAVPRFSWPVNGSILSDFGPKSGGRHNDGLNIGAPLGSPVRAASAGEVVYTGDKVAGFGNLILIRHSGGYATAYAHVQKPLVARGDKIAAGQTIASIGKTGNVSTPQLHFEIRKGTKPINPKTYLP